MTFHKLRQVKALSDIHRLLSGNKNNFTPEWIAFIKKFYLQLKFGSWSLLKLFSIYAHSSIEVSLKKSSWNSPHTWPTEPTPRFDAHRADSNLQQLQQNTFSLQKGPCWSFEVNKTGKQTIFQHISEVNWRSTQIFPNVFSPTRGMACVMSHVILVSQLYCRVNDLGGKIPAACLLFVWPAGRSSPKRFAECCHKENFQDLSKPSKCWYYRQFSEFAIGR